MRPSLSIAAHDYWQIFFPPVPELPLALLFLVLAAGFLAVGILTHFRRCR